MPSRQIRVTLESEPLGLLYAPLELALAAPRRKAGRAMEAAIVRPMDLTRTHGVKITKEKLREVVDSYDPVNVEAATLNFDHTQSGPAHGIGTKLWFEGDTVWGRFEDLSEEAAAGIESGRWSRRSAEIAFNHGATGGWYLTGLALLGAMPPAIYGLPPALLLSRQPHRLQLQVAAKENLMPPETVTPSAEAADTELPPTVEETPAAEAAAPEAVVVAEEEVVTEAAAPEPITMVEPEPAAVVAEEPAAVAIAASAAATETLRLCAENAALSARLAAADRTVLLHQVQAELAACKGVSPGVLRTGVAEAITELRLSAQPLTANLSAAGGAVVATPLADIFLAAFAALPPIQALAATPLATRDADPAENGDHRTAAERQAHLRAGLQDDAYLQLARKYGFNQQPN